MVLLAGLLAGCQTMPAALREIQDRHTRTTAWPYAQTWERARATGLREGYTLASSDPGTGTLVFEREDPGARVRDYAAGTEHYFGAMWWRLSSTLRVRVRAVDAAHTQVRARADLLAEMSLFDPRHGSSALTTVPLTSAGTLERRYLDETVLMLPASAARDPSGERENPR